MDILKQIKLNLHREARLVTVLVLINLTYYSDSSYFVHEQCRDYVAWQHGQASQEADHVDDNVVLLQKVQMAAFLWVEEGGVLHSTVFKLLLPEVCGQQKDV